MYQLWGKSGNTINVAVDTDIDQDKVCISDSDSDDDKIEWQILSYATSSKQARLGILPKFELFWSLFVLNM